MINKKRIIWNDAHEISDGEDSPSISHNKKKSRTAQKPSRKVTPRYFEIQS